MFKDTEEALKRLEAELLAEEEAEQAEQDWEDEEDGENWEAEEVQPDDDLLSDDELNALLEDTQIFGSAVTYQNHANDYGHRGKAIPRAYNADKLDQDPEDLSQELLDERKSGGVGGLVALACILAVGILCVAVWWIARYWGMF